MKFTISYKKAIMPDNIVQHYGEFDDPNAVAIIIEQLCRKLDVLPGDKFIVDVLEPPKPVQNN